MPEVKLSDADKKYAGYAGTALAGLAAGVVLALGLGGCGCGESRPRPRPAPPTKADPAPAPKAARLYLAVVRDPAAVAPAQAALLGDTAFWDSLKAAGHEWDSYSNTSPDAEKRGYLKAVAGVPLPAVLPVDRDTGRPFPAAPLTDKAGVLALVKSLTGK